MPQAFWIIPLEGGSIDNTLPGGQRPADPGYGRPIYHPGHPEHGLPSGGHISNWVPGSGNYPSGQPVPPNTINPPLPANLPEPYDDKVIVAIKRPDVVEWTVKAYDPATFPQPK